MLKLFSCRVTSCSTATFILNVLYSPSSPQEKKRPSLFFPTTNIFNTFSIPGLWTMINPAVTSVLAHPTAVHDPLKCQSTTPPLFHNPLTLLIALIWLKTPKCECWRRRSNSSLTRQFWQNHVGGFPFLSNLEAYKQTRTNKCQI